MAVSGEVRPAFTCWQGSWGNNHKPRGIITQGGTGRGDSINAAGRTLRLAYNPKMTAWRRRKPLANNYGFVGIRSAQRRQPASISPLCALTSHCEVVLLSQQPAIIVLIVTLYCPSSILLSFLIFLYI